MARDAYRRQSAWENPMLCILSQAGGRPSEPGRPPEPSGSEAYNRLRAFLGAAAVPAPALTKHIRGGLP